MGKASRKRPSRLSKKLLKVRKGLGLSQGGIVKALGHSDKLVRQDISDFELGKREPPLKVLLGYARLAGLYVEALIDDELDLPKRLPASPKSKGIRRQKK
jgi:transcriptional regulator with XRE-family HTH domain